MAETKLSARRRLFFDSTSGNNTYEVLQREVEQLLQQVGAHWNFDFKTGRPLSGKWNWQPSQNSNQSSRCAYSTQGRIGAPRGLSMNIKLDKPRTALGDISQNACRKIDTNISTSRAIKCTQDFRNHNSKPYKMCQKISTVNLPKPKPLRKIKSPTNKNNNNVEISVAKAGLEQCKNISALSESVNCSKVRTVMGDSTMGYSSQINIENSMDENMNCPAVVNLSKLKSYKPSAFRKLSF